jgi:hypothetical protein
MTHDWITTQLITARHEDAARTAHSASRGGRRNPRRLLRSPRLRRFSL